MTEVKKKEETTEELTTRFVKNLKNLTGELIKVNTYLISHNHKVVDPNILAAANLLIDFTDKKEIVSVMVERSVDHWEAIRIKDEKFFIENAHKVFSPPSKDKGGAKTEDINAFKIMFTAVNADGKPLVGKDNRENLWTYIHNLTRIMIRYSHREKSVHKDKISVAVEKWKITL